jgi:hypothetical protein
MRHIPDAPERGTQNLAFITAVSELETLCADFTDLLIGVDLRR